ncbi:uncharacterized protein PG986_004279 [Apiospora aurea]|uniref:F-box domain-containing protein n=1 Tax=Apiospora aurea TaxID=335848 RepID=A0ABR1QMW3_9PEZI
MSLLLNLPPELVLLIQECLTTLRDRFALAATCTALNVLAGSRVIYKQVTTEERRFDEARLRLEILGEQYPRLNFGFWKQTPWPEARAANLAKFDPKGNQYARVLEFFEFVDKCVGQWGKGIAGFADGTDVNLYAAIHGTKHGRLERAVTGTLYEPDEDACPEDPPVYLACELNRVDVLDLLHKKGVDINLVKGHWVVSRQTGKVVNEKSRWDAPFDVNDQVRRADAWSQFTVSGPYADFREDVSLWLAEHNLGFPTKPEGLTGPDLSDAARKNHLRLVRFLIEHLRTKLSPDEYRAALTEALHAATKGGNDIHWQRGPGIRNRERVDYYFRGPHDEVFEALLAAGAELGPQDPDREEDKGLLAGAVEFEASNVSWLLRRQTAEGSTDHRDVRAALHEAIRYGSWRSPARLEFFKAIYPANAHLACDPARLTTPEDREEAMRERLDGFIEVMRACIAVTSCFEVALHIVDVVGRERVGERLVHTLELRNVSGSRRRMWYYDPTSFRLAR